jgi:phosphonatase-like hydrolase
MKDIALVVFDMAGTTVKDNREVEYCFAEACESTGLIVSNERILAMQGYAKRKVFEILWKEQLGSKGKEQLFENIEFSYSQFREILENHYDNAEILPTEHCLETFELLKENNIKIALNTGFYRKVANIILEKLGWLDGLDEDFVNRGGKSPIDVSITPTEVEEGRPEPFMIYRAMQLLNIKDSQHVIKIGDTPVDLEEGYKANCWKSLALTNGTHSHKQLMPYKNDGLLNSLADLAGILNLDVQKNKRNLFTF